MGGRGLPGAEGATHALGSATAALVAVLVVGGLVAGAIPLPRRLDQRRSEQARLVSAASACQVSLPASWQAAIAAAPNDPIGADPSYPSGAPAFALTPDGSYYFAAQYSPTWSGVKEINSTTQLASSIYKFPSGGDNQVVNGSMDGRWLVWLDFELNGPESLRAWDSSTGESWTIATVGTPSGLPQLSLAVEPRSSTGQLAWTVPGGRFKDGPEIRSVLHLYSLATRRETAVHRGPVGSIFFWRNQLFFSVGSGAHPHLQAVSATSGRGVGVANAVAGAAAASMVWSGPHGLVWVDWTRSAPPSYSLWTLGAKAQHPTRLLEGSVLTTLPSNVFWTDGYVLWDPSTDPRVFTNPAGSGVVYLGSGSYALVPGTDATLMADGNAMILSWVPQPPEGKTAPVWRSVVLHLNQLGHPPAC